MTTYNTYQEAKIANPDDDIWVNMLALCGGNNFFGTKASLAEITNNYLKCRPADYCMTVEKFLAKGHEFVEGDVAMSGDGVLVSVTSKMLADAMSVKSRSDSDNFILHAAALSKPKRTKTEWLKVNDSIFDLRPDFEAGDLYVSRCKGHYEQILNETSLYAACFQGLLYRRIETEIDWRDELRLAVKSAYSKRNFGEGSVIVGNADLTDCEFIELCHKVAELTDKPTN